MPIARRNPHLSATAFAAVERRQRRYEAHILAAGEDAGAYADYELFEQDIGITSFSRHSLDYRSKADRILYDII